MDEQPEVDPPFELPPLSPLNRKNSPAPIDSTPFVVSGQRMSREQVEAMRSPHLPPLFPSEEEEEDFVTPLSPLSTSPAASPREINDFFSRRNTSSTSPREIRGDRISPRSRASPVPSASPSRSAAGASPVPSPGRSAAGVSPVPSPGRSAAGASPVPSPGRSAAGASPVPSPGRSAAGASPVPSPGRSAAGASPARVSQLPSPGGDFINRSSPNEVGSRGELSSPSQRSDLFSLGNLEPDASSESSQNTRRTPGENNSFLAPWERPREQSTGQLVLPLSMLAEDEEEEEISTRSAEISTRSAEIFPWPDSPNRSVSSSLFVDQSQERVDRSQERVDRSQDRVDRSPHRSSFLAAGQPGEQRNLSFLNVGMPSQNQESVSVPPAQNSRSTTPTSIHSVSQSAIREEDQETASVRQTASQGDRLANQTVTRPATSAGQTVSRPATSAGQTVTRPATSAANQTNARPATRPVGQTSTRPVGQTPAQPAARLSRFASMTPAEATRERARFAIEFRELREWMPEENIPEISPSATLEEIEEIYKLYLRQAYIKDDTRQYELYMALFWIAVEFFGIWYLRMPIAGFSSNQASQITRFRRYLNRIGAEKYVEGAAGKGNPVHALAWEMFFSAAVFIGMQFLVMILSKIFDESSARSMAESIKGTVGGLFGQRFRPSEAGGGGPAPAAAAAAAAAPAPAAAAPGFDFMSLLGGLANRFAPAPAAQAQQTPSQSQNPSQAQAQAFAPAAQSAAPAPAAGFDLGALTGMLGNVGSLFDGQGNAPVALAGLGSQLMEQMQSRILGGAGTPTQGQAVAPVAGPTQSQASMAAAAAANQNRGTAAPVPMRRFAAPYDEDEI